MAPATDNTFFAFNGQGYFSFVLDMDSRLSPMEYALRDLLLGLDYSRFNSTMKRKSKIDPQSMCILIIYCVMNGHASTREMEEFARRNIFLISCIGPDTTVDHTTIARFMKDNGEAFEDLLTQMVIKLHDEGEIAGETVMQDGTKIEARSGRYTFIWKSATLKNMEKCIRRICGHIQEAKRMGIVAADMAVDEDSAYDEAMRALNTLSSMDYPRDEVKGRGHRVDPLRSLEDDLRKETSKLREMDEDVSLIGSGRKSMSKTDHDATFMRMKDDAMRNGQLKPAYNVQNAVDSGYVIACTICSDRTDYYTCIPMMEKIDASYPWSYKNYVADSGYDCNANYEHLLSCGMKPYIKPQDWEISRKRAYKNDIGRYQNMEYDRESDTFTCANGKRLRNTGRTIRNRAYGTVSNEYACSRGCKSCPFRDQCMGRNTRKDYKKFTASMGHWEYRKMAYDLLSTEEGAEMRVNRSIMCEGSFAQMKNNRYLRRFLSFGKKRVFTEWILMAIAVNVIHYANRNYGKDPLGIPDWYSIKTA